ncbi:DMT family transporter [Pararhodobacter oceanensis]|uniref:DMT family transporter n=1 Tax=Pararhodobacter oceanensis TaxID=2172121 RepID=UPI003A91BA62
MNALNTQAIAADQRPVIGVIWMVVAGLLFVGLTAGVKHMGSDIPAAQSAFLRYFLGLIFVLPMLFVVRNERPSLRVWGFFGLRGLMHTFGVILWFYAMTRIPLAEVSAMGYMSPVFISIGAAVFLGERLRMRRLAAVAVAIIGAMVILRPGLRELNDGHVAMLFTSMFFALSYMMAKRTSRDASPTMVVTMLSITVTIGLAPFAFAVWVPVSGAELLWLLMIAGFATAGHYCMTFAFAAAPITVTQPVTALQLVWAVSLGALLFAEPVDLWVVAGGALIVLAVVFIALREHQVKLAEARELII